MSATRRFHDSGLVFSFGVEAVTLTARFDVLDQSGATTDGGDLKTLILGAVIRLGFDVQGGRDACVEAGGSLEIRGRGRACDGSC